MKRSVVVAFVVSALCAMQAAAVAAGSAPFTLAVPPPPGTPFSSTLRDAATAIERAAATNPAAAQSAAFSYNAAIELYHAHAYERARQSALTAILQATVPGAPAAPVAAPWMGSTVFPGPRYYLIGDVLPATPANAQRYVALAQRALQTCPAQTVAATEYRDALAALSGKHYRVAMADARNIVDDCSSR